LPATAEAADRHHPLWGRGFRPFFLGASLHAALVVPLWLAIWFQLLPAPAWLAPIGWHAHEMLFGTVAAAIAGFLTTAAPVWSGAKPLSGRPLLLLAALWGAGRLAMLAAGPLPVALVAAIDLAFLPWRWWRRSPWPTPPCRPRRWASSAAGLRGRCASRWTASSS
jgi:uncharacterized protein involved in response to NO